MKKYRAPGAYAKFIPTQNTIKSVGQTRVMALVGTGQQFFEKKNVLINRDPDSVIDLLPDENVVEIYSISSNPVLNKKDLSNKLYTGYKLKDSNYIRWNALEDEQYKASVELLEGHGDKSFLTNIFVKVNDEDKITNNEYKLEINFIDKEYGTYKIINNLTNEMIGEYAAGKDIMTDVIPGVGLRVLSTFVLDKDSEDETGSKTQLGDYVIIKTKASKCHMDPIVQNVDINELDNNGMVISSLGSNYELFNAGKNAGTMVGDKLIEEPKLEAKIQALKNFNSLKFKIKIYKDGILTDASKVFDKVSVTYDGKLSGKYIKTDKNVLYDSKNAEKYPSKDIYMVDKLSEDNPSITMEKKDELNISINYILNGKPNIDNSNIFIVFEVIESEKSVGLDNDKVIGFCNNIIFVKSTMIPKTIENTNTIFNRLIEDLKVINPDNVKNSSYKIEITNLEHSEISIYEIQEEDKDVKYNKIGTFSTANNNEFREAIPGVIFTLSNLSDIEGLIERHIVSDSTNIDGSSTIITTLAGINNPEIPESNSYYYVSYKYAKPEEDYEPKIFYDYDEIKQTYGQYFITASGMILNSLSLGAEIAMENGATPIVCVQAKNETYGEMIKAIDKLSKKVGFIDNINAIVPLTTNKQVLNYVVKHVTHYSTPEYSMYRMAYFGSDKSEEINKEPTIKNPKKGSIQIAKYFNNERIVYIVPGAVSKEIVDSNTGFGVIKTLPACYLAAAISAIAMHNDPAEPLTNKEIKGFKDLLTYYTEPQMNALAESGCLVVKQEGNTIKIRHGITTHGDSETLADIQSNEITLIQVKDYVIDGCRKALGEVFVGGKLKTTTVHDVEYALTQLLNKYIADDIIIRVEELTVKRNQKNPSQIDVKFLIEAVYPLNFIDISFGYSTTIS